MLSRISSFLGSVSDLGLGYLPDFSVCINGVFVWSLSVEVAVFRVGLDGSFNRRGIGF